MVMRVSATAANDYDLANFVRRCRVSESGRVIGSARIQGRFMHRLVFCCSGFAFSVLLILHSACASARGALPGYPIDLPLCSPDKEISACLTRASQIRLAAVNYPLQPGTSLRLTTGQAIYGLPGTRVARVLIANGAHDVVVVGITADEIVFESGPRPFVGNTIQNVHADIVGDGAAIENNEFIRVLGRLSFNDLGGGYLRNNRFIACHVHASAPALRLVGNDRIPSGGNSFIWYSFQTPSGAAAGITNQKNIAFVGVAAESWNFSFSDQSWAPLIEVKHTGLFGLVGAGFGTSSRFKTPFLISYAERNFILNVFGSAAGTELQQPPESPWTKFTLNTIELGSTVSNSLIGQHSSLLTVRTAHDSSALALGSSKLGRPVSETKLHYGAMGTTRQRAEITRNMARLLAPMTTWTSRLAAQTSASVEVEGPDDTDELQRKLDSAPGKLLQLGPGTFHLGKPLVIRGNQGIVGAGSGSTTLISTSKSDLINIVPGGDTDAGRTIAFTLASLTLASGRNGIATVARDDEPGWVINEAYISDLVIRDMTDAGLLIDNIQGADNIFFDKVAFLRNHFGVRQVKPSLAARPTAYHLNYVDKVVFFECDFIGNEVAVDLDAARQDNQNAWIRSRFINNGSGIKLHTNDTALIYDSHFLNNSRDDLQSTGLGPINAPPTIISSSFQSKVLDHVFVKGGFSGLNLFFDRLGVAESALLIERDCRVPLPDQKGNLNMMLSSGAIVASQLLPQQCE